MYGLWMRQKVEVNSTPSTYPEWYVDTFTFTVSGIFQACCKDIFETPCLILERTFHLTLFSGFLTNSVN